MNYRHAYHAGNFADVLKHTILALVIEHLKLKPAPFRVIDTHAGAGMYDLTASEAARTGEWLQGIGRLWQTEPMRLRTEAEAVLAPYLAVIRSHNPTGELTTYPGSPRIALALMRPEDRLIANELHPEDATALKVEIGRDRRAKVLSIDAWHALRSLLPPKERRGVILIDPPFEESRDVDRLVSGLADGVRRFATGIYLLWLPVKDRRAHARFIDRLAAEGHSKLLSVEMRVREVVPAAKLAANAVVVINAPFGLKASLEQVLPSLAVALSQGEGAGFELRSFDAPRD